MMVSGCTRCDRLLARYHLPARRRGDRGRHRRPAAAAGAGGRRRAIVVDAIDRGAPPGALHRLDGRRGRPPSCGDSPHDAGLSDLLGAAALTGALPADLVLLGLQPARIGWGTTLSPAVAEALDRLVDAVTAQLAAWGCAVRPHVA